MRLRELEDRKRIERLLSMTREYRQTKKEFRQRNYPLNAQARAGSELKAPLDTSSDEATVLRHVIADMRASHERYRISCAKQLDVLSRDRKRRESEHRAEIAACESSANAALARTDDTRALYESTLNDYLICAIKARRANSAFNSDWLRCLPKSRINSEISSSSRTCKCRL